MLTRHSRQPRHIDSDRYGSYGTHGSNHGITPAVNVFVHNRRCLDFSIGVTWKKLMQ
ncbi:MAG: hypothetical protein ICV78_00680 [Tolypothrix sp. Co-bin9]|nr:hypothetical protein [Tolypothrix sp. Co-bin9]